MNTDQKPSRPVWRCLSALFGWLSLVLLLLVLIVPFIFSHLSILDARPWLWIVLLLPGMFFLWCFCYRRVRRSKCWGIDMMLVLLLLSGALAIGDICLPSLTLPHVLWMPYMLLYPVPHVFFMMLP